MQYTGSYLVTSSQHTFNYNLEWSDLADSLQLSQYISTMPNGFLSSEKTLVSHLVEGSSYVQSCYTAALYSSKAWF